MSDNSTIIIKKIKKGGHGHHGGAWKVAYADFVTAMMAFFLLLWLLNSASKEQLHGIADFFSPTIGLKDGIGIGVKGGVSDATEGEKRSAQTGGSGIIYGVPQQGSVVAAPEETPTVVDGENSEAISVVESTIKSALEDNKELEQYKDNVLIDQTPEGLRIQITEKNGKSMFKEGTAELEESTKKILDKVTQILRFLPNYLSISGHTSTSQAITATDGSWGLSGERANAARSHMVGVGLDKEQVVKLVAKADTEPLDTENPNAPVNRRISIIVLKEAKMSKNKQMDPNIPLKNINPEQQKSYMQIQSKDSPSSPEFKARQSADQIKNQVQTDLNAIKENEVR